MTIRDKGSSYITDYNSNQCIADNFIGSQQHVDREGNPVEYILTSCDCEDNEGNRTPSSDKG